MKNCAMYWLRLCCLITATLNWYTDALYTKAEYPCKDDQFQDFESGKCYTEQGPPCGKNMVFVPVTQYPDFRSCVCANDTQRALVPHPKTKQCYHVYSQGPCKKKEWIIVKHNMLPACVRNPCWNASASDTSMPIILFESQCVPLHSKNDNCSDPNERVILYKGYIPQCGIVVPSTYCIGGVCGMENPCTPPELLKPDNTCTEPIAFDFGHDF